MGLSIRVVSGLSLYVALADAMDTPVRAEPSNTLTIHRSVFATLDDAWANAPVDTYCSADFPAILPQGWSVADDTADARIAIELHNFGTTNVVLRNITLDHDLKVVQGKAVIDDVLGIKSNAACPSRILIKKNAPATEEKAPFLNVPITNLITFNGRDYAMADNTLPTEARKGGCDSSFYKLIDGWDVAADNDDTRAVIMSSRYPFKYICKVTASGKGLMLDKTDSTCGDDMLVKATTNGQKLVAVNDRKCGSLMLSRESTLPATWPHEATINNVYTVKEHQYAVLDNTPANDIYFNTTDSKHCQNVAMKIPVGWELAQSTMPEYNDAASQPWGTFCTGKAFDGTDCNYNIISSTTYAAAIFCDQRVLIKRKSIPCVSAWSEWSDCSKDCSPVKTRKRENFTQQAQFGGECQREEKTNAGCPASTCTATRDIAPITATASTTPVRGFAGATIPSALAAFAAVACALMF